MQNLMENKKKVYLIRKSFIDESTEFGRSTDIDVAISICPSGYIVYDEDGNIIHTTVVEDKYKYGKTWVDLKSEIEKEMTEVTDANVLTFPYVKKFKKYINLLNATLVLMNKAEINDSKQSDYEKMWNSLKEKFEDADHEYHDIDEILNIMREVEEGDNKDEKQ